MPNLLDTLEALERQATPGPWAIHTDLRKWVMNDDPRAEWGINRDNDAAFVVAARNAFPALLRMARAADRLLSLDDRCDYVDGTPDVCPGIERDGGPCYWCDLRAALAALDAAGEGE